MAYGDYQGKFLKYDTCPNCGGTKSKHAVACKSCHTGRPLSPVRKQCPDCGTEIRTTQARCRPCFDKRREASRPVCVDCGKPRTRGSANRPVLRCRACSYKLQRSRPLATCSFEGCGKVHFAKGLCRYHYGVARGRKYRSYGAGGGRGTVPARLLAERPCQVCEYDRMPSQLHKIIPSIGYRIGNMVAVCARCHDEIERGITPCPTPMTEDEIWLFAAKLEVQQRESAG